MQENQNMISQLQVFKWKIHWFLREIITNQRNGTVILIHENQLNKQQNYEKCKVQTECSSTRSLPVLLKSFNEFEFFTQIIHLSSSLKWPMKHFINFL